MKRLPVGIDNFSDLIVSNSYYVDKTRAIEELLETSSIGSVKLFPRPRRFGKTLFMSMLENFFEITKKEENKDLFKGLYIDSSKYKEVQNTYPVINISLKSLNQKTFESVIEEYKALIAEIYREKRYLLEFLNEDEKIKYNKILLEKPSITDLKNSILFLSKCLYRHHKKKVVILIDEYDAPIQEGYLDGFYDEIIDFMRSLLSSALKTNNALFMGVLTGVLKVSKESIFSDLNNIKVYSIVDEKYEEYFGFTKSETKELLAYYNLPLTENVRDMYNGYKFGGKEIYNPWSILNYADDKKLKVYWVNTSGNNLIKDLLLKTNADNKEKIEKLILGESLEFVYNDKITYQDFDNYDNLNNVLNILFSSGYLTLDRIEKDIIENEVMYVKIPNKEVKSLLVSIISQLNYENKKTDAEGYTNDFIRSLMLNDKEKLEKILNNKLMSLSFMDSQEYFYHAYTLGIFKSLLDDNLYIVKSNREAGSGRFDVMIRKTDNSIGFIIEFKLAKTEEEMEEKAILAIKQMKEKEYYKELVLENVKEIHEVAMVFYDKKVIVR